MKSFISAKHPAESMSTETGGKSMLPMLNVESSSTPGIDELNCMHFNPTLMKTVEAVRG